MLPDPMNLALTMDDATTPSETLSLVRINEVTNRSTYAIPELEEDHSTEGQAIPAHDQVGLRHQLQFYRTYAKRSGASRGSAKSTVKVTRDVSVPNADGTGNIVLPLIAEVNFSCPVGVSYHNRKDLRCIVASILREHAEMEDLMTTEQI
jgi:hypothetical protein